MPGLSVGPTVGSYGVSCSSKHHDRGKTSCLQGVSYIELSSTGECRLHHIYQTFVLSRLNESPYQNSTVPLPSCVAITIGNIFINHFCTLYNVKCCHKLKLQSRSLPPNHHQQQNSQHAYNGCSQAKSTHNLFRPMDHEASFVWVDRIKGKRPRTV
jgi:hypothetical protein